MEKIIREKRELAYKDHVLINDKRSIWDYIQHNGAAAVVPILNNGKILLVRQYRNALDRYTLELPAGKVDSKDEPRRICAFRELEEETGYKVASPDDLEFLIRIDTMVAFGDEEIDIFVARNLIKSEQHLDEDESIDIEEWELEELVDLIYKGELKDSKTVAAIIAYKNKYNL